MESKQIELRFVDSNRLGKNAIDKQVLVNGDGHLVKRINGAAYISLFPQ